MNRRTPRASELQRTTRRELLKLAPLALGAGLLVPPWRRRLLELGLAATDRAAAAAFDPARLAPTFADSEVAPIERFPFNSYLVDDPEVDLESWRLVVEGAVAKPGSYDLDDLAQLPRVMQNTLHVCIEGWDVVGSFGGVRLAAFLDLVGADPSARFVEFECADDYYESIDLAAARHPQTLLCDEMSGQPLTRGHGAPLRLQTPVKLGYKQAKYLTRLRVAHVLSGRRGYWEDKGYSWYGGL